LTVIFPGSRLERREDDFAILLRAAALNMPVTPVGAAGHYGQERADAAVARRA
jgi:hypothetical protein